MGREAPAARGAILKLDVMFADLGALSRLGMIVNHAFQCLVFH